MKVDAIRETLARQLVEARDALAAERAESAQLRAANRELKRLLIIEQNERRAERDRQASAVRWSIP
ncbi:MAG: hypothetical protein ACLGI3_14245 [Actinomycetes bacterium]